MIIIILVFKVSMMDFTLNIEHRLFKLLVNLIPSHLGKILSILKLVLCAKVSSFFI